MTEQVVHTEQHKRITWWISQLTLTLEDFMEAPSDSRKAGLMSLCGQYHDAARVGQIELPTMTRRQG